MAGWDDLEQEARVQVSEDDNDDLNLLVAKTFGSDAGQKVLEWMREFYLERPCWEPGAEASLGYWKSGQQAVIRDIEARIRKAKNR
jgi:hypothetical protein